MTHPRKPEVSFEREPLRWVCNEAYFSARHLLPDNPRYDSLIAFFLGLASGFAIADLGAAPLDRSLLINKLIVGSYQPENRTLDMLASAGLGATVGTGLASKAIAPQHVNQWIDDHPTYSSGVMGVMIGASLRGMLELMLK